VKIGTTNALFFLMGINEFNADVSFAKLYGILKVKQTLVSRRTRPRSRPFATLLY